jgi:hypothetical protein
MAPDSKRKSQPGPSRGRVGAPGLVEVSGRGRARMVRCPARPPERRGSLPILPEVARLCGRFARGNSARRRCGMASREELPVDPDGRRRRVCKARVVALQAPKRARMARIDHEPMCAGIGMSVLLPKECVRGALPCARRSRDRARVALRIQRFAISRVGDPAFEPQRLVEVRSGP